MKKIVAILLAMLFVLTALVSCSPVETKNPDKASPSQGVSETPGQSSAPASGGDLQNSPSAVSDVSKPTPSPALPADPAEVLKGKSILFCGDSLVMASTYDTKHQWWGWAGRINDLYKLGTYRNAGVDGASVSDCRDTNIIVKQVENNKGYNCHIVVLEGGINDAWDETEVGSMVESTAEETDISSLDLSTFAGGLENLLYKAKTCFPDATICYVINFKLNSSIGNLRDMSEYVEMTQKICDKWGIPYRDLYNDTKFNKKFNVRRYTPDGIHPNSAGYDILAPEIAQFIADEYVKKNG